MRFSGRSDTDTATRIAAFDPVMKKASPCGLALICDGVAEWSGAFLARRVHAGSIPVPVSNFQRARFGGPFFFWFTNGELIPRAAVRRQSA